MLASVFSGAASMPPFCAATFVAAGTAGDWPATCGALEPGIGPGGAAVTRLGAIVLSGATFDEGTPAAAALLFGGIPVVAVREADRLGNGRSA
jgi:hypothetical protein